MATRYLTTYYDVVDHLMDFLGSSASGTRDRGECRRAVLEALREIVNLHRWSYYHQIGRVNTVASYETGTVEYDHTGGVYERQLTLTGGTWPTWAQNGTVIIDSVPYDVFDRKSDSVVTLSSNSNPGADVAASTTYRLYRDSYPLPSNFATLTSDVHDLNSKATLSYIKPGDWHNQRTWSNSGGVPSFYTIVGDPNYHDIQTIRFQPSPTAATAYGFLYKRNARRLLTEEYSTGTVTASGTNVTISGGSFNANHVGCVLRISATADAPTGLAGGNPFTEERIIKTYVDASTVVIDSAFTGTYSAKKFILSDPIDVESQTMLNLFLRTAELKLATIRRPTDRGAAYAAWQRDYELALAADTRYSVTHSVNGGIGMNFVTHLLAYGESDLDSY